MRSTGGRASPGAGVQDAEAHRAGSAVTAGGLRLPAFSENGQAHRTVRAAMLPARLLNRPAGCGSPRRPRLGRASSTGRPASDASRAQDRTGSRDDGCVDLGCGASPPRREELLPVPTSHDMFSTTRRRAPCFCAITARARRELCGAAASSRRSPRARGSCPSRSRLPRAGGMSTTACRARPVDVGEELLERLVEHRPRHDRAVVLREEPDRHHLQLAPNVGRSTIATIGRCVTPSKCGIE